MIEVYGYLKQREKDIEFCASNGDVVCSRVMFAFNQHMDKPEDSHYKKILCSAVEELKNKIEGGTLTCPSTSIGA